MIRMIQSKTASRAKAYFNESLLKSDYYVNDQELNGTFRGGIAKQLGIEGLVTKHIFHALCENINPVTGDALTARKINNRTVGYDINFHCPKSVSILHALSPDKHLLDAFHQSVIETMDDIDKDAKTRVRKNGADMNRPSKGLLYADFVHQTARPVKEKEPDPHLHCHCFVFNVTWDEIENKYKAAQFRDIKRDMPYYQSLFHKRLSDNLMNLGYAIKPTRSAFEIEGVPEHLIELFSKRTNEIGQVAKEQNITEAKKLDALGGKTRAKKKKGFTIPQLKKIWIKQIREMGFDPTLTDIILRYSKPVLGNILNPADVIQKSLLHYFERASVVQDRRILEKAIRSSIGSRSLSIETIKQEFKNDIDIIKAVEADAIYCTTAKVLEEEKQILALVNEGRNAIKPLVDRVIAFNLHGDQKQAVEHVLTTHNRVAVIMGRAGTGKTTLMKAASAKINEAGKKMFVVAPTAQASRGVLRDEGFSEAETVTKLLSDMELQASLTEQVLWVDEAGLLGTSDMLELLKVAKERNAQIVFSGDTNQHSSVVRGDALRFLHEIAGVDTITVSKIYRQKKQEYKEAIEHLSKGNIQGGYKKLESMNAIIESDPEFPEQQLVADYIQARKHGKSVLVVSPTHKQCLVVTDRIRTALKVEGMLDKNELIYQRYENLNLTEAEKQDPKSYKNDQIIQLNQNANSLKRGSIWKIDNITENKITIVDHLGNTNELPLPQASKFDVYLKSKLLLAKGDKIQVTRNGFDEQKKRLNNGQELLIKGFYKDGSIIANTMSGKSEFLLSKNFGHINHAYCLTSHASQGKTVDRVLVSQPSSTFTASDMKQFYVSASRGKESVTVYTDDKEGLLDHISNIKQRMLAMELLRFRDNAKTMNKSSSEFSVAATDLSFYQMASS